MHHTCFDLLSGEANLCPLPGFFSPAVIYSLIKSHSFFHEAAYFLITALFACLLF
jgi:hypothetical protein